MFLDFEFRIRCMWVLTLVPLERLEPLRPESLRGRLPVGGLALALEAGGDGGGLGLGGRRGRRGRDRGHQGGRGGGGGLQHGLQDAAAGVDEPVVHL